MRGIWSDVLKEQGLEEVWEGVYFIHLREERETGIPKGEANWASVELVREGP